MVLAVWLACALGATEKPKLAVLDLQASGVPGEVANALTEALNQETTRRGYFEVITASDVRTLLGIERQRQLLGCAESSCTAELAGALGARFVLGGTLSKLGDAFQLSLQTVDTQKSTPVGRSVRIANELKELVDQLPYAIAEATATPPPAPPSRVLPISLISVGAASVIGGAILGFSTILEENGLSRDLSAQDPATGRFLRYEVYQEAASRLGLQRTGALVALIAGGAVATTGVILLVRTSSSGTSAWLVPMGTGLGLAGVWP